MNLDKSTAISALKDRPPASVASAESQVAAAEAETASRKERGPLPKRRDVTLPPPGPVAGPAVLAMDPVDDGPTDTVREESTND
jgi:hypothetical protein